MDWSQTNLERVTSIASGSASLTNTQTVTSPIFDMRQFSSFYLTIAAQNQTNPATNYNDVQIVMNWYTDNTGATHVYTDKYNIIADNPLGAVFIGVLGGRLVMQDVCHGPFMQYVITENGPNVVGVTHLLEGTTRNLPGPYVREVSYAVPPVPRSADNYFMPSNKVLLGASSTTDFPCYMRYGPGRLRTAAINGAVTVVIYFASGGGPASSPESWAVAGGTVDIRGLTLPKETMVIRVTNNVAVNNNFEMYGVSEMIKF